ncbi:RHH-type proline utilization regulon transcriptional repressor/proline dehydrogenase/delta 1-pyrroline-5-carboxylate dehydrogenase [Microbacteriaceae bacterium SG_E_30_P1]|uniref:L-glutamate gamma-semialdehyde dehydrogenase n=1 Tax=Antiquaquibacter oligotrophicus TaxID=2880260 RepID=A0ABT6KQY8_9MICO|nr:proline dehydrogenase family protein [Antiquaquibacter oligotrophicus]MDH6182231.1 RHH-type proline utilization regulon transcriptional repressor/proline dehydrogenase/delta 1-pyrroline-5-carboxylate dehydrogenase [Antiquaquibacter oligotrophicus]UDF12109.1 proline dehydrogenase family protein [Antiquaquibacter oligotrophicus]
MSTELTPKSESPALTEESVATVRRWLEESKRAPKDARAERLAHLLRDPLGLDFALGFVDTVVRPEDLGVAARNLRRLSRAVPSFLPWYLRSAVVLGGTFAPLLPWIVVPIARRALRGMVAHLVIDATPQRLDKSLAALRSDGVQLNLNLLGEAVLGDAEAARRLEGTRTLLERSDVDYVSIKVSSIAAQLSPWAFEETVDRVVDLLTPLYELAARGATSGRKPTFINLDMEEYRDLALTIAVFRRILDQPQLKHLEAGIVLQAYLPDALGALDELTEWAQARRAAGGAGIKVRIVKGANLAMERVDARMHGWPLATWSSKAESDASFKRVIDRGLNPERTDAVRLGIASHNLFDVAWSWHLSRLRGVADRVEFEMLLGMASGQSEAVRRDVGGLRLYTPLVHPAEFDSAISYLVRRLEENSSPENIMSGLFELATDSTVFEREERRFRESLALMPTLDLSPRRTQDRASVLEIAADVGFDNEADTDPSLAANRDWGRRVLERSADSRLGAGSIASALVTDAETLDQRIALAAHRGAEWGSTPGAERARLLHDAGDVLAAFRGRLVEVMASEAGKTIAEADVEVSEAVDFAHYYAERAAELDAIDEAVFVPSRVTVVTPPWNFPVAIPAGSVLAALAAGSAVIIKPAPQAKRSGAVMVEALWEAGVPRDLVTLVDIEEGDLGRRLVTHPDVDRVILTGGWETAELFRSWRPDLDLHAETSGKNAIIVTPSADLDLAAADVVRSAFGHAGQKCSAASLVILVGSVGRSERFRRQLVDSVRTLRVGYPQDATSIMGPLIEPPRGKLLRGLTELGDGEEWLVEPQRLDETGRLWSPGVRTGVRPGSEFHRTEYFGPILGVMTARDLDEAIALQNGTEYGLTAGIHSLDPAEVAQWIDGVEAGNLYVNRGITGAIVQRQPFGGWKRSTVGTGTKAGGPNYVLTLGEWSPVEREPVNNIKLDGVSAPVATVISLGQAGLDFPEFDRVRRAARSDERAWQAEFGVSKDAASLDVERNLLRYRPVPITLRLSEGAPLGHLVRLIAAGTRAGSPMTISSALPLPSALVQAFSAFVPPAIVDDVVIESDAAWLAHASQLSGRVRLVGGDPAALAAAVGGSPDVAIYSGPVTTAGRIELLPFLREQSVTITGHRFGNPDRGMLSLEV